MSQTVALEQLFEHVPFKQLTTADFSTVWLMSTTHAGNQIQVRSVSDRAVRDVTNPSTTFENLTTLLKAVLAGAETIDVAVGRYEFCISEAEIVGGVEYAISPRGNAPPSARSEISVSI
jgi:hypothetical protein